MIKYEVGKKFPHDKYFGREEVIVSIMNEAFVDVLVCLNDLSKEEKKAFKSGRLTVGLFQYKQTPFIVFDLGDGFNFDVSIDMTKIDSEQQEKWLNSDANAINMFLVDASSYNLEAMRMIGVNFSEELRDILEEQSALNTQSVKQQIDEAMQLVDTGIMLNNATKKITF